MAPPQSVPIPPPDDKPKTRDWTEKPPHIISCFPSTKNKQSVGKFWETTGTTPFHTRELVLATKELNRLLVEVGRHAPRPDSVLSFIAVGNRLLLVWAVDDESPPKRGTRSDAKMSQIAQALKLRDAAKARLQDGADDKPITYTWVRDSDNFVKCTLSEVDASCHISNLWQTTEPTAFRPRELMEVTTKLQKILDGVARKNSDIDRKLGIIIYDYKLILVWTVCSGLGPSDDRDIVRKALKLKVE